MYAALTAICVQLDDSVAFAAAAETLATYISSYGHLATTTPFGSVLTHLLSYYI